jgi:hypothetical protein
VILRDVPEDARDACFENAVFKSIQAQVQYETHAIWRADDAVREIILR